MASRPPSLMLTDDGLDELISQFNTVSQRQMVKHALQRVWCDFWLSISVSLGLFATSWLLRYVTNYDHLYLAPSVVSC